MSLTASTRACRSRGGSRTALIGFAVGLFCGAASIVHATVACGSFDRTTMRLVSIRKNGVEQALPERLDAYLAQSYGGANVIDPETGEHRELNSERVVTP